MHTRNSSGQPRRLFNFAALLALIVLASGCVRGQLSSDAQSAIRLLSRAPSVTDPRLKALDLGFQAAYAQRRADALLFEVGPVVVTNFKQMLLITDGTVTTEAVALPTEYFLLRYAAHIPLTLKLAVLNFVDAPLPQIRLDQLARLDKDVRAATPALAGGSFTPAQRDRQVKITHATIELIADVLRNKWITQDELDKYMTSMKPLFMANATDAARAQVDAMHNTMKSWWNDAALGPPDWSSIRVVVVGIHQARRNNVATQYFAALLDHWFNGEWRAPEGYGYPGEGIFLFYEVTTFSKSTPRTNWFLERSMLATQVLDANLSDDIFGNLWRFSEDLMADGAKAYIPTLDFSWMNSRVP